MLWFILGVLTGVIAVLLLIALVCIAAATGSKKTAFRVREEDNTR